MRTNVDVSCPWRRRKVEGKTQVVYVGHEFLAALARGVVLLVERPLHLDLAPLCGLLVQQVEEVMKILDEELLK